MKNSVIFNTEQVSALQNGTLGAFVCKIKMQPIIDSESGFVFEGNHKKQYKNDIHHEDWRVRLCADFAPYQVGQKVYVREKWAEMYDTCDHPELPDNPQERWGMGYYYGTDKVERKDNMLFVNGEWIMCFVKEGSPANMPKEAARHWLEITGVECVMVNDVPEHHDKVKHLGNTAISENHYVFLVTFKKIDNG